MYHVKYHNWRQTGGLRDGPDQQQFYGHMASVAYGNTTAGREEKLKKFKLDDWVQDTDLSTPDVAILVNKKTKEIVSSVTGSRFTDPIHRFRDIRSDIGIALGTDRWGNRTKEVSAVVKKAGEKYKGYDSTLVGHSLGGKVASNISKQTGIPTIAFNIGSSPLSVVSDRLMKLFGRDHKDSKVIHYTTNKGSTIDPLSVSEAVAGTADKTVLVDKKTDKIAHSLGHFAEGAGKITRYIDTPWIIHVRKVRQKNKDLTYKQALKLASASYKKVSN
jgi:hypothetical protein